MVKEVLYELIDADAAIEGGNPYLLLEKIRQEHHEDTLEARIALAWKRGIKADPDGHVILGQCVRSNELNRELTEYDFCIVLNQEVWTDVHFTSAQKMALIDHEMCHVGRMANNEGEWVIDSKDRPVWRVRKHDIEEFRQIVERHGLWKADLERFGQAILEKKNLLALAESTPERKVINGETILIAPKATMGTELIDPFPDGKVQ